MKDVKVLNSFLCVTANNNFVTGNIEIKDKVLPFKVWKNVKDFTAIINAEIINIIKYTDREYKGEKYISIEDYKIVKEKDIKESLDNLKPKDKIDRYFSNELALIKSKTIEKFTRFCLTDAPDYFWVVGASSTSKYHRGENNSVGGLVRHTKGLIVVAEEMFRNDLFCEGFTETLKDCVRSACLLHDIAKHGFNNSKFTVKTHPLDALVILNKHKNIVSEKVFNKISKMVASHSGPWTQINKNSSLPLPETKAEKIVHLCDYIASRKDIIINLD